MRGGPDRDEVLEFLRAMAAGRLPFTVVEGGGGADRVHLVCGFLGWDLRPFNPLLAEARDRRAGGECVRLRLSELMFVEVVRRHLAALPPEETGCLAAVRDPVVGRALVLLHDRPGEAWTLEGLAREAGPVPIGARRPVRAPRGGAADALPRARWRVQVAARLLSEGEAKVSAVAAEVG